LALLWEMAASDPAGTMRGVSFYFASLLLGYLTSTALGIIGLARRNLLGCALALPLVPLYWLLLSLAAWRALGHLLRGPYGWEKTEHGRARNSRLEAQSVALGADLRSIGVARPPIPRGGA